MATSGKKLNLRLEADRSAMLDVVAESGLHLTPDVLQFACSKLTDDWLVAWAAQMFNVRTSRTGRSGIGLADWAELVQSIYDLKDVSGIDEQIRRLCAPAHETLDTCLALQIAGRYARQGFAVEFEPNGKGCSDLLIQRDWFRSYVEVKRENEQDHKRFMSIQRRSSEIIGGLESQVLTWLEGRDLRLEVRFPRSFSPGTVAAITDELVQQLPSSGIGEDCVLNTIRGASYVLLKRSDPAHYQKGIHWGFIRVRQPGTPVQMVPQNMPILVIFDWLPNITALKWRIQKASKQLRNDGLKDPEAWGFFVMQFSHGEAGRDAIIDRYFSALPRNCFGIVLLSNPGFVIPAAGLSKEITQVMALAGNPSASRAAPSVK